METQFEVNVSRPEAARRYLISIAIIGAVLLSPNTVPSWLALVACYPAFTAMIQWDPINTLSQSVISHSSKSVQDTLFRNPTAI